MLDKDVFHPPGVFDSRDSNKKSDIVAFHRQFWYYNSIKRPWYGRAYFYEKFLFELQKEVVLLCASLQDSH